MVYRWGEERIITGTSLAVILDIQARNPISDWRVSRYE